jgi:hypothetical protein
MPMPNIIKKPDALAQEDDRQTIRKLRYRGVTNPHEIARILSRSKAYVAKQIQIIMKQDKAALSLESKENNYFDAIKRLEKELSIFSEIEARLLNDATKRSSDPDAPSVNTRVLRDLLSSGEHVRNLLKDLVELQGLTVKEDPKGKTQTVNSNSITINVQGNDFSMDEVKRLMYDILPKTEEIVQPEVKELEDKKVVDNPTVIEVEAKDEGE